MNLNESQVSGLRRAFRALNRNMLMMWRLGLGWTMQNRFGGYVMVLITTGRKSGERRLVPLNFTEDSGAIYCLAGFGKRTHWLLNLEADNRCELWLPDGRRLHGKATTITLEERRIEMIRRILVRSGFAVKLAEPGLNPMKAPNEVIAELGSRYGRRYEVVEIELGEPVTGPGGPGDLRWLWPVGAAAALIALVLRRRTR